jgi:hypothetical protein
MSASPALTPGMGARLPASGKRGARLLDDDGLNPESAG